MAWCELWLATGVAAAFSNLQAVRRPAIFELIQRLVPKPLYRPAQIRQRDLRPLGQAPSKRRRDTRVFPGQLRNFQSAAEFRGQLLGLLHEIRALRIKKDQPVLQVSHASRADPGSVSQRPNVADMQLHRDPLRVALLIRPPDVT